MNSSNLAHKEEFKIEEELQEKDEEFQEMPRPHRIYHNNMITGSEKPQAY
jgi:hypothetical protein